MVQVFFEYFDFISTNLTFQSGIHVQQRLISLDLHGPEFVQISRAETSSWGAYVKRKCQRNLTQLIQQQRNRSTKVPTVNPLNRHIDEDENIIRHHFLQKATLFFSLYSTRHITNSPKKQSATMVYDVEL
ncbi:hypothetical protein CEXT_476581 [Caerostris extrusa]|uniref:Uncharacterized protein n=1 Tax=Caerostris extrusa TaxID=172846 RepID=A0AAV4P5J4_CAEEX|nr:hypothetical protein CEXT_476581 [Caerostris extrusa]